MNPIKTSKHITESYYRYIMTRFPFGKTEPETRDAFKNLLESESGKDKLIKGPILEITPPYKKGRSLKEFSKIYPEWKILCDIFAKNNGYKIERPLFLHQEKALIRSIDNNIVVASGTGSGKTEAFLFPIMKYCLENPGKGVRALIIYPLNALIEDQIRRLGEYLKNTPVTFGKYTGQTPKLIRDSGQDERRCENHLISREEMRATPPNILITNYAMLEYILLRPGDSSILDERDDKSFKFIILDEAHSYSGAQGTEVAYLIKRLRDRVGRNAKDTRCFATSATLGDGNVNFAVRLFGAEFTEESLIIGEKEKLSDNFSGESSKEFSTEEIIAWGLPEPDFTLNRIKEIFKKDLPVYNPETYVYEILKDNKQVRNIINILENDPKPIVHLAREIFNQEQIEKAEQALVNLVAWADFAKDEESKLSLIPARYHMFVSATKGLFCSLKNFKDKVIWDQLSLTQHDVKNGYPFELCVCKVCGEPYIIGIKSIINENKSYKPVSDSFFESLDSQDAESTKVLFQFKPSIKSNPTEVCIICGVIDGKCEHKLSEKVKLYEYDPLFSLSLNLNEEDTESEESDLPDEKGCINCGSGRNLEGQLVSFRISANAATAILASSLYSNCPEMERNEIVKNNDYFQELYGRRNHDWTPIIEKGKKLMVFSDSRQEAAFFGPYLQVSHNQLLFNSFIYRLIKEKNDVISLTDLVDSFSNQTNRMILSEEKAALFLRDLRPKLSKSKEPKREENFKNELVSNIVKRQRIYHSILTLIDRSGASFSGLEGLGLGAVYYNLKGLEINTKGLELSQDKINALAQLILFYVRLRQAFYLQPESDIDLSEKNDAYYEGRYSVSILINEEDDAKSLKNSVRLISKNPNRLQLLFKNVLFKMTSKNLDLEIINDLIRKIANEFIGNEIIKDNKAIGYQLNLLKLNIIQANMHTGVFKGYIPGGMDEFKSCKKCGRLSWIDIGMCNFPNCFGELDKFENTLQTSEINHYRNWFTGIIQSELRAAEHTAQLNKMTAAKDYQDEFKRGRLNILSSSTTFEMGVDLGDLSIVFMRNIPPGAANYVQRAGRAGRRPGVSPFVLTFCRNLPHDQYFFSKYSSLVKGQVNSPAIVLENEKIIKRHYNAVILSEFFNLYKEAFRNKSSKYIGDPILKFLFEKNNSFEQNETPSDYLCESWLPSKFNYFKQRFDKIFMDRNINQEFFENSLTEFVNFFVSDKKYGLSESIGKKYIEAIDFYNTEKNKFNPSDMKQQKDFNFFNSLLEQTQDEILISYLSSRGFLPSYAFPIDVVPLEVLSDRDGSVSVDLNREMGRAISEYAPGATVIANSKIYISGALHKFPKQKFEIFNYYHCPKCQFFILNQNKMKVINAQELHITQCIQEYTDVKQAILPKWGFAVPREKNGEFIRINTRLKRNSYASDLFMNEDDKDNITNQLDINAFNKLSITLKYLSGYNMFRINKGGVDEKNKKRKEFIICETCGRSLQEKETSHTTPYGYKCDAKEKIKKKLHLMSIFDTDVIRLSFDKNFEMPVNIKMSPFEIKSFWRSLLYAILESMSRVMEIERKDIDGIYRMTGKLGWAELILIDSVSGGAGHVARFAGKAGETPQVLMEKVLSKAFEIVNCSECNENTACYSCLFHYSNQKYQHLLNRGIVFKWLKQIMGF